MKMIDDAGITDDPTAAANADRTLLVRFTTEKRQNQALMTRVAEHNSSLEERAKLLEHAGKFEDAEKVRSEKYPDEPIYRDIDFISIQVPGDALSRVYRPIQASDKIRFRDKYAEFKAGRGETVDGTPLVALTGITDSQVKALEYSNIKTVEALANVADGLLKLMGGSDLKQRAVAYVAKHRKSSVVEQTNAALAERDAMIAALTARLDALEQQKPAKAASK